MVFVKVGVRSDLIDGEMTAVQVGDEEVLLARLGDEVLAVSNLCSHAEGWLDMGTLLPETKEVQCPLHDGRFSLLTGAATREPCIDPIPAYTVQVRDDEVYVEVGSS
jgi:nitrite reductase/ring-hydroxylating ferredoxin subunit